MLFHSISEGSKNIFRSFWLSVTAIFIIFVSLSSVAIASSVWVSTGYFIRQLDNQAVLYVNLKEDTTEESIKIMEQDLKNVKEIKEFRFIDKEEAKRELENNEIAGAGIKTLENASEITKNALNNVRSSFKIVSKSAEEYKTVLEFVKQDKYKIIVDSVIDITKSIETIKNLYYISSVVGLFLVLIFALIAFLVMINILRIAIYSKKEEIEIMRLVGATNNYIRGPFIVEGILYNLIAGILSLVIFVPSIFYLTPKLKDFYGLVESNSFSLNGLFFYLLACLLLTNVINLIIGIFSSYFATQKYLQL
jgi:cell division transport system permease protein